jgi:beta-xylosidase
MNEKQFIVWFHGFLEISEAKTLNRRQVQIIKDHLNQFFVKVTPELDLELDPELDIIGKFQPLDPTKTYC